MIPENDPLDSGQHDRVRPKSPPAGPQQAAPSLPLATRHGRLGETLAAAYLELAGYRVLARNRRWGPFEVDLIAQRGEVIAFVEVRLRSNRTHGRPEDSLGWRKRAHLVQAVRGLLGELAPEPGRRVRLDVIAIEMEGLGLRVRHLPGWPAPAPFD
jgi:putative endonuclease